LADEERTSARILCSAISWLVERKCLLFVSALPRAENEFWVQRLLALSSIAAFIDEASAQSRLLHTQLPRDGRVYCHQGMFQTQPLSINTRRPTTTIRFDSNYYYLNVRVGCILDVVT
jgi:hypothetical protein